LIPPHGYAQSPHRLHVFQPTSSSDAQFQRARACVRNLLCPTLSQGREVAFRLLTIHNGSLHPRGLPAFSSPAIDFGCYAPPETNSSNVCIFFAFLHYSVHSSGWLLHPNLLPPPDEGCQLSQTIFVLEDDADIARLVQHHLDAAGFEVRLFHTPTNLIPDAERKAPALFLLDIMVPGGDGLDVCRRLRNHQGLSTTPIIFMTARAAENDRVLGLELGADDYITKPFSTRELVARVKAVLRRFERPSAPSVVTFEDIVVDAGAMQLTVRGELTTTTATEFRLLDYLARHPGRVFSRDHLLDAVWGDARFVTPRSVDVYVRRIREKIEVDPENPRYLKTVRGAGYRFELPKGE
jgi:DNA-binding response OmpR family regulator